MSVDGFDQESADRVRVTPPYDRDQYLLDADCAPPIELEEC
ncbi:MAG TPA: hypothetical protein VKV95_16685 [Terriglobia bacterium]|nr:hypothetical protein [Terriglobia bacterium]